MDDLDEDEDYDEIIGYEIKWVVFLSAGFADIAVDHGGINVFAFDLKTGTKLWHFSSEYANAVNDIPGAATVYDLDGYIFLATAFGSMEGSDPRMDVSVTGQASGNFYKLKLEDGSLAWKLTDIGKVRGSIFVNLQHAYMTTIDGLIIQIGGDDFAAGTGTRVVLRTWRQM